MSLVPITSRYAVVSVCDMNQHSLDFEGNYKRIRDSILAAKSQGSRYRLGPELETCGYSCEDHFEELETLHHNYSILEKIISDRRLYGIFIDIGCFVHHKGVRYNTRAIIYDGKILLIRPKTVLASDKSYYEARWFTAWTKEGFEEWPIPPLIKSACMQDVVPIGVGLLELKDSCIGIQICEEMFVPDKWHRSQVLNGAEIITNGSGSLFELGKMEYRFDLIRDASERGRCGYMYSNLTGCDGGRLYFDGGSLVFSCGKLAEFLPRFKLCGKGFTVMSTFIDLDEIKGKRSAVHSWSTLAANVPVLPRVKVDANISMPRSSFLDMSLHLNLSISQSVKRCCNHLEELVGAPTHWLWDYLRKSGASGVFVPLSGGADSSATAVLVYIMCEMIYEAIGKCNDEKILRQLRKIVGNKNYTPDSGRDVCNKLLVTAYLPSNCSSEDSRRRAAELAADVNSVHFEVPIEEMCSVSLNNVCKALKISPPKFKVNGGSEMSDRALQNLQARQRMVQSYLVSQLYVEQKRVNLNGDTSLNLSKNPLLVIGTANADEGICGYFTKYDCSAGDISLLSDVSKTDILLILKHGEERFGLKSLEKVISCTPSAELVPLGANGMPTQSDEDEIGLKYSEISFMRKLRRNELLGPLTMFRVLADLWYLGSREFVMSLDDIALKVKRFFTIYGVNRHKTLAVAPGVHIDGSGQDDSRADFRPFLYKGVWKFQFRCIDEELAEMKTTPKTF